jgi:hypothetical protein
MARKRPNEPIAPTTIPGEPTDPKIPPEDAPESDQERQARESEKAFDQAITRIPPG